MRRAAAVWLMISATLGGVGLYLCSMSHAETMDSDLKRKLSALHGQGLWIADYSRYNLGELVLFPMAVSPRRVVHFPPNLLGVSLDGRYVITHSEEVVRLHDPTGAIAKELRISCDPYKVSVTSNLNRIAYSCAFRSGSQYGTRYYITDADETPHLIAERWGQALDKEIALAANGTVAVLAPAEHVILVNTRDWSISTIDRGSSATVSPDGTKLAYRRSDGVAMIADSHSLRTRPIMPHTRVLGRMAWSPDGQHLLFSEEHEDHSVIFCSDTRIGIYRINDGSVELIIYPCEGLTSERFGWLTWHP